jgi:hypothetical protein
VATAFATPTSLLEWLPVTVDIDDADAVRLLDRATEVIDAAVRAPFRVDAAGTPLDPETAEALASATCAQVEFWLEVGEEHDVAGLAGRQVSVGQLSISALPPVVAPRAARLLAAAGLMSFASDLLDADTWAGTL